MREFAALPNWLEILFNADLDRDRGLQDPVPLDGSYYLFTNISNGIDEDFLEEFSTQARRIADEVFGPDVSSRLGFGIATPAAISKVEPHELTAFTVDLINMPSSYYMLALEGRISVVPVREHGEFVTDIKGSGNRLVADVIERVERPALAFRGSARGFRATAKLEDMSKRSTFMRSSRSIQNSYSRSTSASVMFGPISASLINSAPA